MITYFIACIFYYISLESEENEDLNGPENVELVNKGEERTFLNEYFVQRSIWENS
jgi:hypothetical protein